MGRERECICQTEKNECLRKERREKETEIKVKRKRGKERKRVCVREEQRRRVYMGKSLTKRVRA